MTNREHLNHRLKSISPELRDELDWFESNSDDAERFENVSDLFWKERGKIWNEIKKVLIDVQAYVEHKPCHETYYLGNAEKGRFTVKGIKYEWGGSYWDKWLQTDEGTG